MASAAYSVSLAAANLMEAVQGLTNTNAETAQEIGSLLSQTYDAEQKECDGIVKDIEKHDGDSKKVEEYQTKFQYEQGKYQNLITVLQQILQGAQSVISQGPQNQQNIMQTSSYNGQLESYVSQLLA